MSYIHFSLGAVQFADSKQTWALLASRTTWGRQVMSQQLRQETAVLEGSELLSEHWHSLNERIISSLTTLSLFRVPSEKCFGSDDIGLEGKAPLLMSSNKRVCWRVREAAQPWGGQAALPDDWGHFPASSWWLTTIWNYSSRDPMPSSALHWHQLVTWNTDIPAREALIKIK